MTDDIPQYIQDLPTNLGFNFVEFYRQGQDAVATLPPESYSEVMGVTIALADKEFKAGKLDAACKLFLTVAQLSEKAGDYNSLIITLSNLGIIFQNARAYDVAKVFANEGCRIADEHNLLEMKLKALQVLSLTYTNTQEREKHMETMERAAEIHGQLGQHDQKEQILAQVRHLREFMGLLDK